jgi:hypothetical protein
MDYDGIATYSQSKLINMPFSLKIGKILAFRLTAGGRFRLFYLLQPSGETGPVSIKVALPFHDKASSM